MSKASQIVGLASQHATILVLDYGSQYTQLIARRIREIGMFSVLFPGDADMVRANGLKSELSRFILTNNTPYIETVEVACMFRWPLPWFLV